MKEHDNDLSTASEQNERGVNQNSSEASPEFSPREPHHNPIGAIIGTVILFTLIVLGGLYMYGSRLSATQAETDGSEEQPESEPSVETSESSDLETLEAELETLEDFENMGADLESSFDAEFGE